MSNQLTVTVAVLTFRRNDAICALLPMLLRQVDDQESGRDDTRTFEVLVVDNDPRGAARQAVASVNDPRIRYVVEAIPGIASARNRVLDECVDRDVLVFIDDDEVPTPGWLRTLLDARTVFAAAAVAGPVQSIFDGQVDEWIQAGGFFGRRHRLELDTGTPIPVAATNNLLLDLRQVRRLGVRFPVDIGMAGGEDNLFTRAMTSRGALLVWCAEALVTEVVPADRATRRWVLERSLSSGNSFATAELRMAPRGIICWALRARLLVGGVGRMVAGSGRWLLGCVTRSMVHQARGLRTTTRGLGMVLRAGGYSFQAYRRALGEETSNL